MFCKWCGNGMSSSETTCKRCGKEIPALSDCGGFYDLVNKEQQPTAVTERSVISNRSAVQAGEHTSVKKKRNVRKMLLGLAAFTLVGFIILFSMLFVLQGEINRLSNTIDGLKNDLANITDWVQRLSEEVKPEESDPEKDPEKNPENESEPQDNSKTESDNTTENNTEEGSEEESVTEQTTAPQ